MKGIHNSLQLGLHVKAWAADACGSNSALDHTHILLAAGTTWAQS